MKSNIYSLHFRWIVALSLALFLGIFISPLVDLVKYCIHPDHSRYTSYVVFIPIISGYLMYSSRRQILDNRRLFLVGGVPAIFAGIFFYMTVNQYSSLLNLTDQISVQTFSVVVSWIGGFLLLVGPKSFRLSLFPLLFLVFLVPIPTILMDNLSHLLQVASTDISYFLFRVSGTPVLREGFSIHLPRLSILIAPECSGIRATITLFVLSVLAGHLFLRTTWKKIVAVSSIFPITIIGNSIRIVVLTFMALYVNRGFIVSDNLLHERGGWVLFGVDLVLFGGIVALLQRNDARKAK